MANWVFCNRCFQPPHRTSCFSLTNCGHVYCDACLGKDRRRYPGVLHEHRQSV
ncbi:RNF212 isoform 4 [Pongo abelii]|uniref:RNF212 isoform 4 n=1 Tax=Pongo abelii TaxID=9601 RepID=A0A2J8SS80_PONAB|nr:RNF212 isoform 4 [Pongo abelii]